jgi:hypothetical protein
MKAMSNISKIPVFQNTFKFNWLKLFNAENQTITKVQFDSRKFDEGSLKTLLEYDFRLVSLVDSIK